MTKNIVALFTALMFVGGGCAKEAEQTAATLKYTLPSDGSISVASKTVDASTLVSADALLAQAQECGGFVRDAQYYLDIENTFTGATGTQYTFSIVGEYEMPTWTVTVLPNTPVYSSLESFKTDFDICAVGGALYPKQAGAQTLLFANSCGSGYSAGGENGCDRIRTTIEPTLVIE